MPSRLLIREYKSAVFEILARSSLFGTTRYRLKVLHENKRHLVFRAVATGSSKSVIVKLWKPSHKASFFHQLIFTLRFFIRGYEQTFYRGTKLLQESGIRSPMVFFVGKIAISHYWMKVPFIVMEDLHGENLLGRITTQRTETDSLLRHAFSLMKSVHRAGILHGDLSLNNFLYLPSPGGNFWNSESREWYALALVDCDKTKKNRYPLRILRQLRAFFCLVRVAGPLRERGVDVDTPGKTVSDRYREAGGLDMHSEGGWLLWLRLLEERDRGFVRGARRSIQRLVIQAVVTLSCIASHTLRRS